MIHPSDLNKMEFSSIYQLYDHMVKLVLKEKRAQCRHLMSLLSRRQKIEAMRYFNSLKGAGKINVRRAIEDCFLYASELLENPPANQPESLKQLKLPL